MPAKLLLAPPDFQIFQWPRCVVAKGCQKNVRLTYAEVLLLQNYIKVGVHFRVINLPSNTFGNPIFQHGLQNQSFSPIILLCLAWPTCQKLGLILVNKVFFELKLQKYHFNKKCTPKRLFFDEKKNQENLDDF